MCSSIPHPVHCLITTPQSHVSVLMYLFSPPNHLPLFSPRDFVARASVSGNAGPVNGLLSAMVGKTWSQFIAQDRSPADSRSNTKSNDCENMKLKKEGTHRRRISLQSDALHA